MRQKIGSKTKRKKKSQSLEAIFRLPKSVLDKFRNPKECTPLKRQRSKNQRLEATIELGYIGQQYHHNLRKTILNHTKQLLNTTKTYKSTHQQNNYVFLEQYGKSNSSFQDKIPSSTQYESNMKTLSILQKAIIKQQDLFEAQQNIFQLQANRLPIIRKRQSKRKQIITDFQKKVQANSPARRQTVREVKIEKKIQPILNKPKQKVQKAEIRGWDIPQYQN